MKLRLVCDLPPRENNPRNSEGAFLRAPNGDILFAYSAYIGVSGHDHATCNIAMIRSLDEGETWTATPEIIAKADFFGTKNIMSVSACPLLDGSPAFYFLIKENDGNSTLGRVISRDGGVTWVPERTVWNAPSGYYVINNDRISRFSDGRIVAPAAFYSQSTGNYALYPPAVTVLLVSEDDGASFSLNKNIFLTHNERINLKYGMQEPGIIELTPGNAWIWMRTGAGYQYESRCYDYLKFATPPEASEFTSPDSPMQITRYDAQTLYAIYNPIPNYNGRKKARGSMGRTPLAIRKSKDNGKTFGDLFLIEDGERGFCYPAMFFTKDGSLLCAYCRGGEEDEVCLYRLGIMKISAESLAKM